MMIFLRKNIYWNFTMKIILKLSFFSYFFLYFSNQSINGIGVTNSRCGQKYHETQTGKSSNLCRVKNSPNPWSNLLSPRFGSCPWIMSCKDAIMNSVGLKQVGNPLQFMIAPFSKNLIKNEGYACLDMNFVNQGSDQDYV